MNNILTSIEKALTTRNIAVDSVKVCHGVYTTLYIITPSAGTTVTSVLRATKEISQLLSGGSRVLVNDSHIAFEVPNCKSLTIDDLVGLSEITNVMDLPIVLGAFCFDGKACATDLAKDGNILVAGNSLSSIKEFLNSAIYRLPRTDIRYTIISTHNVLPDLAPELYQFEGGNVAKAADAAAALQACVAELEKRKSSCKKHPRLVIVIEGIDIFLADKERRREIARCLIQLASQGAESGVHLIISQSQPVGIQALINFNFSTKVVFRASKETAEAIQVSEANHLLDHGDALLVKGFFNVTRIVTISK